MVSFFAVLISSSVFAEPPPLPQPSYIDLDKSLEGYRLMTNRAVYGNKQIVVDVDGNPVACSEELLALYKNEQNLARYTDPLFKRSYLRKKLTMQAQASAVGCDRLYSATDNKKRCLDQYVGKRQIQEAIDAAHDYMTEISELGMEPEESQREYTEIDSFIKLKSAELAEAERVYTNNACRNIQGLDEMITVFNQIGDQCNEFATQIGRAETELASDQLLKSWNEIFKKNLDNCMVNLNNSNRPESSDQ